MPMRITPYASDADAQKAAQPKKLKTGWHRSSIDDAVLRPNKNGDDMIDARFVIVDDEDNRWEIRDYLSNHPKSAARLRHLWEAVGAAGSYAAGVIDPAELHGHEVAVRVAIQKRYGQADRYIIDDYRAPNSSVVNLRTAG